MRRATTACFRATVLALLTGCACGTSTTASTSGEHALPPIVSGPPTFEAWIEANHLLHAPSGHWVAAAAALAGIRVRWPLSSWGGETTTGSFDAPNGWRGNVRTRFVSRGLSNLGEVDAAGSIVIVCPNSIDDGAPELLLEGTVLGVVDRGTPELWLGACVVIRP